MAVVHRHSVELRAKCSGWLFFGTARDVLNYGQSAGPKSIFPRVC